MTRIRWFQCGGIEKASTLFEKLLNKRFERTHGSGFVPLTDPTEPYAVRYIWTTETFSTRVNEFGEFAAESVLSESYVDFVIKQIHGCIFLRIRNPNRSVLGLFNAIEREVGFGFWSKGVDLLPHAGRLMSANIRQAKLIGLKITNVALEQNILGRMEFLSKDGIFPDQLKALRALPHTLEYAAYDVFVGVHRGQIAFMRTGLVKVSQQLELFSIELVENDLITLSK